MFKELRYRMKCVKYTTSHRKAFRIIEKELLGRNTIKGNLHDMDKVILYPILGKKLTSKLHKKFSRHHSRAKTEEDFIQTIIDWESCRFTKSDKPLNAYDTLYALCPDDDELYLPLLIKYNLVPGLDNNYMYPEVLKTMEVL